MKKWLLMVFGIGMVLAALFSFSQYSWIKGLLPHSKQERAGIKLHAQPSGSLTEAPEQLLFLVTGPVQGRPGTSFEYEMVKKCIRTAPEVQGHIVWSSEKAFNYTIERATLLPETRYSIKVDCLPVSPDNLVKVEATAFNFITPPLQVTRSYVARWDSEVVEARLDFTFPIRLLDIQDYISVSTIDGRPAPIIRISGGTRTLTLVWKNLKEKAYRITLVKGLPSADGRTRLERDMVYELTIPERLLFIGRVVAIEATEGYSIKVDCVVQGTSTCQVDAKKVKEYLQISPGIPFQVQAESQGFQLYGNFLPEQTYSVKILAGLPTKEEGVLREDYNIQIKIPHPSPRVTFAVRGHYLGKKGGAKVPLQIRQVEELELSIYRLPPENLGHYRPWQSSYYQYTEPVLSRKKIPTGGGAKTDLFWLDLRGLININEPGIYELYASVASKGRNEDRNEEREYYDYEYGGRSQKRDSVLVVISDLALIAKRTPDRVNIWAMNASNGMLVEGAEVQVVSQKNVPMGGCTTNNDGYCSFAFEPIREREAALLIAHKEKEWTFLHFGNTTIDMEPFDVSGLRLSMIPYLTYLYPERDIYRPGEMVHFAAMVRDKETYRGVKLPLKVRIYNPKGQEFLILQGETDTFGLSNFSFKTDEASPTGKYGLQLYIGEKMVTSGFVFVESFAPERLTVKVKTPKTDFNVGEPIPVEIQADYLFGVPAGEASYRILCSAQEVSFYAKERPGFSYGVYRTKGERVESKDLGAIEGRLDKEGRGRVECLFPNLDGFKNLIDTSIHVEVMEAGSGRATKTSTHVRIHPFPFYIGLKPKTTRIEPHKAVTVNGILINRDSTLYKEPTHLSYQVYRLRYESVRIYNPDTGRFEWTSSWQRTPSMEAGGISSKDGHFTIKFTPEEYWYDYILEVRHEGSSAVVEIHLAGWGWWWETERPDSPETLKIQLNKSEADYDEKIEASLLLPFEGKILWAVEQDRVIQHAWQEARGDVSKWSFSAPKGRSSVYVTALLIRVGENYLVRRAFGLQRLPIHPKTHRLDLKVETAELIHPGEELSVVLQAKDKFKGTVAIVDEGILQVTRFKTPDVYQAIFSDLALEVGTAETLGWVIPKGMERAGGGERFQAVQPTFIRLVSYWSGLVESDAKGRAMIRFPVPIYHGKLRIMFSGANDVQMSSGERSVIVTSDVVVSPTIPRFVHNEDELDFPVAFTNTTDQAHQVDLNVTLDGASPRKPLPTSISIPPKGSEVVWVPIRAGKMPGTMGIHIQAISGRERYQEDFRIPMNPNRPYLTEGEYLQVKPGRTDLLPYIKGWVPFGLKTKAVLTPIPALSGMEHLKYLIRYPYGCVEQTSSTLLPLLRLTPLLPTIAPEYNIGDIQNRVQSGIARLISMQTPSGGFSYWPGGHEPHPWSSIYVTFILLEAKEAGYMIPDPVISQAMRYVGETARQTSFGYFVLAKGGRLKPQDLEELTRISARSNMTSEELLWIAGALQYAGRVVTAKQILERAIKMSPPKDRRISLDFYSPGREMGARLFIAETINPASPNNESLVMEVIQSLKRQSYYYTTQELAWGILGLGLRVVNSSYAIQYEARLMANGKSIQSKKTSHGILWEIKETGENSSLELRLKADGDMYLYLENSGFKDDIKAFLPQKEGISIQRRFLNLLGEDVESLPVKEMMVVELTLEPHRGYSYENSAVEARVPAGWEIENPRLIGALRLSWVESRPDLWHPDYIDVRDDTIQIFGTLKPGIQRFYFLARMVTPGDFFLPPTIGSVMYNPEIRASTEGGRVKVSLSR